MMGKPYPFSRRRFAPELWHASVRSRHHPDIAVRGTASFHSPMPVVHAAAPLTMPVEALRKRRFGMEDERTKQRKFGGETPTDANVIMPGLTGSAAPSAEGARLSAFHRGF